MPNGIRNFSESMRERLTSPAHQFRFPFDVASGIRHSAFRTGDGEASQGELPRHHPFWAAVACSALMAGLHLVIVFFQRHIVSGVAHTGLAGQ
jgi:hypothetical protein